MDRLTDQSVGRQDVRDAVDCRVELLDESRYLRRGQDVAFDRLNLGSDRLDI
jgi:hypothetical protein